MLLLILMVPIGFLSASPASAATQLVDTAPADGKQLTSAPSRVSLAFSADVLKLGATITVNGPSGAVAVGVVKIKGKTVSRGLTGKLADGQYTVRWKVAAQDGRPMDGTFRFGLRAPVEPTGTPSVTYSSTSPAPAPSPSPHTAQPQMTGAMPGMVGMSGPTTPAATNSGATTGFAIAGLVLLTATVVGAIAIERRRHLRPAADPSKTSTD